MRKVVCLICVLVIVVCGAVNVMALNNGQFIENISINTSTGTANCYAKLTIKNAARGSITCVLQKNTGSNWVTLATWTASGSATANVNQSWPVVAGFTYRICVTHSIYDSNGSLVEQETHTVSKHYPRNLEYNAVIEESLSE